jgi:HAD superfamily hydrolase (TIGR01509 family)
MSFPAPFWTPSRASAFIFDWDGVIAETSLDFTEVKNKYYGDKSAMLLEDMVTLEPCMRESLMRDLEDVEMLGAARATPVPGVSSVLEWVKKNEIPWAVVSRNCRKSILKAAEVIEMTLPAIVRSRDDGDCVKPDPRALRQTCEQLSAPPSQSLLIGDYIYDMMGARRAGMRGVLVRNKIADDWTAWLECFYASMDGFYGEIISPTEMIPWEYQETAKKYGVDFLTAVHKIFLRLPEKFYPSLDAWIARAASLGVGGFVVGDERFSPAMWKQNPSFDPACMGLSLAETIRIFLLERWPFASVTETSGAVGAVLTAPPANASDLPEFLLASAQAG